MHYIVIYNIAKKQISYIIKIYDRKLLINFYNLYQYTTIYFYI